MALDLIIRNARLPDAGAAGPTVDIGVQGGAIVAAVPMTWALGGLGWTGAYLAAASVGVLVTVGLLLVVAIGSNYALFFDHLRQTGTADPDTLASLALANLTTVSSFGLLAVSGIPALHAIGVVVAPGALLSLLLSAAFIRAGRPPDVHGKMAPTLSAP